MFMMTLQCVICIKDVVTVFCEYFNDGTYVCASTWSSPSSPPSLSSPPPSGSITPPSSSVTGWRGGGGGRGGGAAGQGGGQS